MENKIAFLADLLEKVKTGEKTETRRMFKKFETGDIIKAYSRTDSNDFAMIKCVNVYDDYLLNITEDQAKKEGCKSRQDFLNLWDSINMKLKINSKDNPKVCVIKFERID